MALLLTIVTLTLIGGTESLATIAVVDKIDPFHRKSDPNVTLRAMGISNILSSPAGSLTIIPGGTKSTSNILASSASMKNLLARVRDAAQNAKTTVLLTGETGTGKKFLARVLHHNGPRAAGPFVKINCTAISPDMFERELFGYERGVFAGAEQRELGLLEQAETGTLFLDEVGDLDAALQAKLLMILEDRSFRRLGGTEDLTGDFRVIGASSRDLKQEVTARRFREDLYFRLNVLTLQLPPLRQRVEDIVPLSKQCMVKCGMDPGKEVAEIDPAAVVILELYPFPDNVRELQNVIEWAMMCAKGKILTAGDLPLELREVPATVTSR